MKYSLGYIVTAMQNGPEQTASERANERVSKSAYRALLPWEHTPSLSALGMTDAPGACSHLICSVCISAVFFLHMLAISMSGLVYFWCVRCWSVNPEPCACWVSTKLYLQLEYLQLYKLKVSLVTSMSYINTATVLEWGKWSVNPNGEGSLWDLRVDSTASSGWIRRDWSQLQSPCFPSLSNVITFVTLAGDLLW